MCCLTSRLCIIVLSVASEAAISAPLAIVSSAPVQSKKNLLACDCFEASKVNGGRGSQLASMRTNTTHIAVSNGALVGTIVSERPLVVPTSTKVFASYSPPIGNLRPTSSAQGVPSHAPVGAALLLTDSTADQVFEDPGTIIGNAGRLIGQRQTAEPRAVTSIVRSVSSTNPVAAFGDSLTAGAGSKTGGWLASLRKNRSGQIIINYGIGGQTSAQIASRVLADAVHGRVWNRILAMGRNDVGVADLSRTVLPLLAEAYANGAPGTKTIVATSVIPAANEKVGSANWNAIAALRAHILSIYGGSVADVCGAITSNMTAQIPISYRAVTAITTGTYLRGSSRVDVASASGILSGMFVTGLGIPDQTTITISGPEITLSSSTTAAGSASPLSFVAPGEVHLNDTGYSIWRNTIDEKMRALGM